MKKNNYSLNKKSSVLPQSELELQRTGEIEPIKKEEKLPIIFTKKVNDNLKVIPLNKTRNTLGHTRHFPAATREWFNSVYAYNPNSIKNLPIADKTLSKIIKSYFNLYFSQNILKSKRIAIRFRKLDLRKIFVSKAELKHTSHKVIITLYVYNEERRWLNSKIKSLRANLFPTVKLLNETKNSMHFFLNKELFSCFAQNKSKFSLLLKKIERIHSSESLDNMYDKNFNYNNLTSDIKASLYKDIARVYLQEELMTLAHYKLLLNLNKSKFEDNFLYKLKPLISDIYNKEVEFNIVNLKTLYFNSDIFTQAISTKLKNRDNKLIRVLKSSLQSVQLPDLNKTREKYGKDLVFTREQLWLNNVKNLKVNNFISAPFAQHEIAVQKGNEDILDKLLLNIFPCGANKFSPLLRKEKNLALISSPFDLQEGAKDNSCAEQENKTLVLDSLKYKTMAGVRLEAKGRLTKRFTASRSVFKVRWKGNLKNIDSSYRGLSSVILRGHVKPNVQYSVVNSKNRNGSFGLKGWIGNK